MANIILAFSYQLYVKQIFIEYLLVKDTKKAEMNDRDPNF